MVEVPRVGIRTYQVPGIEEPVFRFFVLYGFWWFSRVLKVIRVSSWCTRTLKFWRFVISIKVLKNRSYHLCRWVRKWVSLPKKITGSASNSCGNRGKTSTGCGEGDRVVPMIVLCRARVSISLSFHGQTSDPVPWRCLRWGSDEL